MSIPEYDHDHNNEVIPFALTNFRNQDRKFGIKTDDRRRHVYVIGKTGMGKTTLIENMVMADIYAGHGVGLVDPHGDFAEHVIECIPSHRINDVIYFNPSDMEYPVGFNILEAVEESHKHLVASGLMGVFKKIWPDVWSARMEHIMNNCIMSLLDYPGSTLLGINRLLTSKSFRARVVASIKDPVVKSFWVEEYNVWEDKFRKEAIAAIQNKVGQFLSASIIRNMLAQVKSTINIRAIMDNRQILIMNLAKGRIGEDNSKLLGGMLITKIQLAAMERVDMPEKDRQDFYLYVDEFQNFATQSFANILSEARKYRLNLIVAHQYIEQLDEEYVRPAIFGNVGTIIAYRVGAKDAEFMENEFMPTFTIQDLVNLTKFQIYLKLMIDGVSSNPFSANTLPPFALTTGNGEKVVKVSRERYAVPRSVIEEKVIKWSEPEEGGEEADEKPKKNKTIYEATCSRCAKKFSVGFKFDPSRPIYCEDCLELVRSGAAKPVRPTQPPTERIVVGANGLPINSHPPEQAPVVQVTVPVAAPVLQTPSQPAPQRYEPRPVQAPESTNSISLSALKSPPPPRFNGQKQYSGSVQPKPPAYPPPPSFANEVKPAPAVPQTPDTPKTQQNDVNIGQG